jgi:hypothetical protein
LVNDVPHFLAPLPPFVDRLDVVAKQLGDEKWRYHGICIGAILEYLLQGVPFDVVKTIGRWSSEAFTLYLHRHAVV